MNELADERAATKQAIERLHLNPMMIELWARLYPPRDLETRTFDAPDEIRIPFEKGRIDVLRSPTSPSTGRRCSRRWRWSEHVKPVVGTESCQRYHLEVVLSGRQHVVMADGAELDLKPGDVAVMPPGRDAWVDGDEPNVLLELVELVHQ